MYVVNNSKPKTQHLGLLNPVYLKQCQWEFLMTVTSNYLISIKTKIYFPSRIGPQKTKTSGGFLKLYFSQVT